MAWEATVAPEKSVDAQKKLEDMKANPAESTLSSTFKTKLVDAGVTRAVADAATISEIEVSAATPVTAAPVTAIPNTEVNAAYVRGMSGLFVRTFVFSSHCKVFPGRWLQ